LVQEKNVTSEKLIEYPVLLFSTSARNGMNYQRERNFTSQKKKFTQWGNGKLRNNNETTISPFSGSRERGTHISQSSW